MVCGNFTGKRESEQRLRECGERVCLVSCPCKGEPSYVSPTIILRLRQSHKASVSTPEPCFITAVWAASASLGSYSLRWRHHLSIVNHSSRQQLPSLLCVTGIELASNVVNRLAATVASFTMLWYKRMKELDRANVTTHVILPKDWMLYPRR